MESSNILEIKSFVKTYTNVLEFKREEVMKNLIPIGYWYSKREPDLPMPTESIIFDPKVVEYLKAGTVKHQWKGFSSCRICGVPNGSKCLTDGKYIWPEGLAHYVEEHGTSLPEEFLNDILSN